MPRRTRGLSGAPGTRIGIRGFTGLLKNLDPGVRNQLESAFVDAERLGNQHLKSSPEQQNKRRISGLIQQIQLRVETTLLGGFVSWDRLDDNNISFYEVQTSDSSIFSIFESFQVLEQFFVLENLTTTKFIRVRGVRGGDGEAGIWSETATVSPVVTAANTFSFEFYQGYSGTTPDLTKIVEYGGGTGQNFTTIFSNSFYSIKQIGSVSIHGYISNRLKAALGDGQTAWDRMRWKVNGISYMDGYWPLWTTPYNERNWDFNQFYNNQISNLPMSGPALGGYTAAFGPFTVAIPNAIAGSGPNDADTITSVQDGASGFYWQDNEKARYPSTLEEAQLPNYAYNLPANEANALHVARGSSTDLLVFRGFNFNIPSDRTITGIKVDVKRRQQALVDIIGANFGIVRPDKALGHDLVLEYKQNAFFQTALTPSNPDLSSSDVFEDISFGRYLDTTGNRADINEASAGGCMCGDLTGIADDGLYPDNPGQTALTGFTFPGSDLVSHFDKNITTLWNSSSFSISSWYRITADKLSKYFFDLNNFFIDNVVTDIAKVKQAQFAGGFPIAIVPGGKRFSFNVEIARGAFDLFGDDAIQYLVLMNEDVGSQQSLVSVSLTFYRPHPLFNYGDFVHSIFTYELVNTVIGDPSNDYIRSFKFFINGQEYSFDNPATFPNSFLTTSSTGWILQDLTTFEVIAIYNVNIAAGSFTGDPIYLDNMGTQVCLGAFSTAERVGQSILDVAQLGLYDKALSPGEAFDIFDAGGRGDLTVHGSPENLTHYFFAFQDPPDMRDQNVLLVDNTGFRTDLDDKAITDETWPQLGRFLGLNAYQYGVLPQATSDGIPHDNHLAVGYQSYGGLGDTWGGTFTPAQINDPDFGFAIRARNNPVSLALGNAFIDHGRMTVYCTPSGPKDITIDVDCSAASEFYLPREVFGGLLNVIELGS